MESSPNETVRTLSDELNIPRSTIYNWVRAKNKRSDPKDNRPSSKWSSEDKFYVVLETVALTEEELSAYCRKKGLYVDDVKTWRIQCMKANNEILKNPKEIEKNLKIEKQKTRELERELQRKEKALAEAAALLVLQKNPRNLGGPRGRLTNYLDRTIAVELIDEARASGTRLQPACKVVGISIRTYQRWTEQGQVAEDQRPLIQRPAPKNKLTRKERDEVIKTANSSKFADLPPTKIVPALADEGKYIASESTFQVWTWDITWLDGVIRGCYYKLYLVLNMYSRLIVGSEVWETEKSEYSEILIRKAVLAQGISGSPLVLHSDNGSPMKTTTFQATLERLGIQSSFSRPRVSNDNPYSEALFKTMKYIPKYPSGGFSSLAEARQWVREFVYWYNYIHLHSGINFITPYQMHYGLGERIMQKRITVYEEAKKRHPERWSGNIRDWSLPEYVALNPIKESELEDYGFINKGMK